MSNVTSWYVPCRHFQAAASARLLCWMCCKAVQLPCLTSACASRPSSSSMQCPPSFKNCKTILRWLQRMGSIFSCRFCLCLVEQEWVASQACVSSSLQCHCRLLARSPEKHMLSNRHRALKMRNHLLGIECMNAFRDKLCPDVVSKHVSKLL